MTSLEHTSSALRVTPYASSPAAWDAFVHAQPQATFCHLAGWRRVMEDVFGHETLQLAAFDVNGSMEGVMPIVRVKSRLFGTHLRSMPYLNYGGAIGTADAQRELNAAAIREGERTSVRSCEIRSRHESPSPIVASGYKVTVLLDLPESAETLWNDRFNAKFRGKIKRPQREGMETRFGPEHLDAFYRVFAGNMRDLGTPVLPRAFFARIVEEFPSLVLIGATYFNDAPVAAGFGFIWRDEFEMTWSSSVRELGAMKPNMLLYWDYMRELIGRGIRTFNFGRSTPGSGPHEFKRAWGAVDAPLPWIQWPPASATESRESSAVQLASRLWRHLPLPVANALGPSVAGLLPWW